MDLDDDEQELVLVDFSQIADTWYAYDEISKKLESASIYGLLGQRFINDMKSGYIDILYDQAVTNETEFSIQVARVLDSGEYAKVRFVKAVKQILVNKPERLKRRLCVIC